MKSVTTDEPKGKLEIRKGADARLDVGGLQFVACRREVDVVDGGITLYVNRAVAGDERELLRFDLFRNRPHYHAPASNAKETEIHLPPGRTIDDWSIEQLTRRAGELVAEGGFDDLAGRLDLRAIGQAAPALHALLAGLVEPTEISYFEVPAAQIAQLRGQVARS